MLWEWWITFSLVHFLAALFFLFSCTLFTQWFIPVSMITLPGHGCICGQDTRFVPSWVVATDASPSEGIWYDFYWFHIYYLIFYLSGTHLSIVACFLLFQVQVEEIPGPFHGLKDLTWSIQLHLRTLPFSFLKKKLILMQTIGRTLFQKYTSMNLQLIGLAFAMLWTWMLVLEGKQKNWFELFVQFKVTNWPYQLSRQCHFEILNFISAWFLWIYFL